MHLFGIKKFYFVLPSPVLSYAVRLNPCLRKNLKLALFCRPANCRLAEMGERAYEFRVIWRIEPSRQRR